MWMDKEENQDLQTVEPTVSRFYTFLCSYELHRWTRWKVERVPTVRGHLELQKRHCVACGRAEQTSVCKLDTEYLSVGR